MSGNEVVGRRNLVAGWCGLLFFLLLGLALELMHGFKVSWYLAADHETRRFLWVLAHAHGALLGLLNIAYGLTVMRPQCAAAATRTASFCLLAALVLMPAGFLSGGLVIYQGDPGPGIALALLGAALLICGVAIVCWRLLMDDG